MPEHHTPLIATIAAGLLLAYVLGLLAHRLRIQPLAGYVLAGVLVGPFTPGFVADPALAGELAEIGVILLMFGVGLHFSLKDLMAVARIVVPGAIVQIVIATLFGAGLGRLLGWSWPAGLVFGLALSVASTVVMVRAFQERHMLDTERGRIAVGWLVVEDLVTILVLVLLPTAAMMASDSVPVSRLAFRLLVTLVKVGVFVALMLLIGRRLIPWLMHYTAHTGSRELFRLAVYALAIGVAFGAAKLFDVSFALGAFFAGIVMGESTLSQQATEEALPLRDAFAVLFFVSVGMLINPEVFVDAPLALAATVLIIVGGKAALSWAIVRAFRLGNPAALAVAAGRAQIGEFSFILIGLGVELGLMPSLGRDLVLGGAIISIMLNPLLFALLVRRQPEPHWLPPAEEVPAEPPAQQPGHDVLIGYGRVGSLVGASLRKHGAQLVVIETNEDGLEKARLDGAEVFIGNAADPDLLASANLATARRLFVTIPEAFEAGQVVQQARAINPGLEILARAHSDAAVAHLERLGATLVVLGEREIAERMLERADAKPT